MRAHFFKLTVCVAIAFVSTNCSNVDFSQSDADLRGLGPEPTPTPTPIPEPNPDQPDIQFVSKTLDVEVQESGEVDILFVVDNSGSMRSEQNHLANRIYGFMDMIDGLDWQIAMTTTDPRQRTMDKDAEWRQWGDGQFRPFDRIDGRQFILKAGEQPNVRAQEMLATAIRTGINGSADERGINAVYRAIERISDTTSHQEFFRPNAALAVVLISDEDECSNFNCSGDSFRSYPQNLMGHVHTVFGAEKRFRFHSLIWVPGDNNCSGGANAGNIYQEMSLLSGGVVGSICAPNYTSILQDIGDKVIEDVSSLDLECEPQDIDNDGKANVFITVGKGNVVLPWEFKIKGKKVHFDKPLPKGKHQVIYHCIKE
jgi:hypothetical protein